jgi:hypothetical protein
MNKKAIHWWEVNDVVTALKMTKSELDKAKRQLSRSTKQSTKEGKDRLK